jgi:hypothetical protein
MTKFIITPKLFILYYYIKLFFEGFIMRILFTLLCISINFMANTITKETLHQLTKQNPFSYDLGITIIPAKTVNAQVTICCHGYGHSKRIVNVVDSFKTLLDHLIGFNFPDHNITAASDHNKSSFGSVNELLPLLYILKQCAIDLHLDTINLYGFSAGGGAIINTLAILNQSTYDAQLADLGISTADKKQIIAALTHGIIILDCPLKSISEIIALRGKHPEFIILDTRYTKNNMQPINALEQLQGLALTILLHFQNPDEILGNRDDHLFAERLQKVNQGKTMVVIGNDGGHNSYHTSLWNEYKKIIAK